MTSTATPVSAATEQEDQHNDNQDHFHGNSPLMTTALLAEYLSVQRPLGFIVPDKRETRQLALWGVSNFAQSPPKFKRAIRRPWLEQQLDNAADQAVQSIDSPVTVLGGNLPGHAPFLADDLFQIHLPWHYRR
jgi:hypothetical protein